MCLQEAIVAAGKITGGICMKQRNNTRGNGQQGAGRQMGAGRGRGSGSGNQRPRGQRCTMGQGQQNAGRTGGLGMQRNYR